MSDKENPLKKLFEAIAEGGGGVHVIEGKIESGEQHMPRPATREELGALIDLPTRFAVGDVVTLKDTAPDRFKFPKPGDELIVTQVLDQPYRCGDESSSQAGNRGDFAAAFAIDCDNEDHPVHVVEHLYDSRFFKKVGTIHH